MTRLIPTREVPRYVPTQKRHGNSLKDGEGTMRSIPKELAERESVLVLDQHSFPRVSGLSSHGKNSCQLRQLWRREKLSPGYVGKQKKSQGNEDSVEQ